MNRAAKKRVPKGGIGRNLSHPHPHDQEGSHSPASPIIFSVAQKNIFPESSFDYARDVVAYRAKGFAESVDADILQEVVESEWRKFFDRDYSPTGLVEFDHFATRDYDLYSPPTSALILSDWRIKFSPACFLPAVDFECYLSRLRQ